MSRLELYGNMHCVAIIRRPGYDNREDNGDYMI